MKKYSFLQPITLGSIRLKNRIILPAMAKYICGSDGYITDAYIAYYTNIAKGGAALLTTGIMPVDSEWGFISQCQPYISDDRYIPRMKQLVDSVHRAGAKLIFQPWHSGQVGTGIPVDSYSLDRIGHIQDQFFQAARRAKEAGADGVEFHMAHTYLGNQFMSPAFNRRDDRYGAQTPQNAARFSVECIDRIWKELCDDSFIVTVKLNGNDFTDAGVTPKWAAKIAVELEKAKVAMITVNGGGRLTDIAGMSDHGKQPEGWKVDYAATVKQAVSIPIAAGGSIRHPDYADACIREGKCDLVALARGLHAEPEWVLKAEQGREDELRMCISCMYCFTKTAPGIAGCSVNPFAKRESEKPAPDTIGNGRKVSVIGAGPSGLEAAVTLAERGFAPEIFERENTIGGQIVLAATPPEKEKLGWLIDYYQRQINRLAIPVHLNFTVTSDQLRQLNPYAIVVATGSNEAVPGIPGIDGENVLRVRNVLRNRMTLMGKKAVILGGGMTGLETGRYLQKQGTEVTVLEMLPKPQTSPIDMELAIRDAMVDGVKIYYSHKALSISVAQVIAEDLESKAQKTFVCDFVVLSLGIRSDNTLFKELSRNLERVYAVGDCGKTGKIFSAVQSGSDVGYSIA